MRVATLALFVAITAVTAFLYTQFGWLLILVRFAVVVGAISVFAGLVMTSEQGEGNV